MAESYLCRMLRRVGSQWMRFGAAISGGFCGILLISLALSSFHENLFNVDRRRQRVGQTAWRWRYSRSVECYGSRNNGDCRRRYFLGRRWGGSLSFLRFNAIVSCFWINRDGIIDGGGFPKKTTKWEGGLELRPRLLVACIPPYSIDVVNESAEVEERGNKRGQRSETLM
jgi:hypothetical protein